MKGIYVLVWISVLLGLFLNICVSVTEESSGEYEYYDEEDQYYDEYEEEVAPNGNVQPVVEEEEFVSPPPPPKQETFYGFHRINGGGLVKISRLLVDEKYINDTSEYYDCVKRVDVTKLIVENETLSDEPDITQQIDDLKKKLQKTMQSINKLTGTGDDNAADTTEKKEATDGKKSDTSSQNATSSTSTKSKRLSFREKQAQRTQMRVEREKQREMEKPKYRLGADCETMICGSCKAIVEEFSYTVYRAVNDSNIKYVDQLTQGFCGSKSIALKYIPMVGDICKTFDQDDLGYKETLLKAFELDDQYEEMNKFHSIKPKQKHICTTVGACEAEQFTFQTKPAHKLQENWDDKCFVCQAFAFDLEERVQLSRHVTEGSIVPMVKETCDRLFFPSEHYRNVCQELTEGKLLDDIAWLGKVHGESVLRKAKAELRFPDKLCEEINWCQPWIDPVKLREKEAEASLEPVFF